MALEELRADGAPTEVMGVQVSVVGLYLAPSFRNAPFWFTPPHTIISVPVQARNADVLGDGAPMVEMTVETPVVGLRRTPSLPAPVAVLPPQMIASVPVHTVTAGCLAES